jgi:hypothetical protein
MKKIIAFSISSAYGIDPKYKLFPYQVEGINKMLGSEYSPSLRVLCDQMGLGKTIQAIGVLHKIQTTNNPENKPHLIVVPSDALVDQWKVELIDKSSSIEASSVLKVKNGDDLTAIQNELEKDASFLNGKTLVTTYNVIKIFNSQKRESNRQKRAERVTDNNDQDSGPSKKKARVEYPALLKWFEKQQFSTMILDEIHTMGSVMSYKFDGLRSSDEDNSGINADSRYALSGTPIEKTMHEVVATLAVVFPGYDYKELRGNLVGVATGLGQLLTQLKSVYSFSKEKYGAPHGVLKDFVMGCKGALDSALSSVAHTLDLMQSNYILRDFDTVKKDFLACSDPKISRNYKVSSQVVELEMSEGLISLKNDVDKLFKDEWAQTQGASTVFHVSGKRNFVENSGSSAVQAESLEDAAQEAVISANKSTAARESRLRMFRPKIDKIKFDILPNLNSPAVITVDTMSQIGWVKGELKDNYQVFDVNSINEFNVACNEYSSSDLNIGGSSSGIGFVHSSAQVPLDRINELLLNSGLTKTLMGDLDDMVPPNRVFVHAIVSPDRSTLSLNKTERDLIDYLDDKNTISELLEEGYLGLSGLSKCICFGKESVVREIVGILKKYGFSQSDLSSHMDKASAFEIKNSEIKKYRKANLKCFNRVPLVSSRSRIPLVSDCSRLPIMIIKTDTNGLNLVNAKNMILMDQPKDLALKDQVKARIDRIKQQDDICFYEFKPTTKMESFYADVCSLQSDAMKILVNPKAFSTATTEDESKKGLVDEHLSMFFIAKAIFELITKNIDLESITPDHDLINGEIRFANKLVNLALLKDVSFKDFFISFKQILGELKAAESSSTDAEAGSSANAGQQGDAASGAYDSFSAGSSSSQKRYSYVESGNHRQGFQQSNSNSYDHQWSNSCSNGRNFVEEGSQQRFDMGMGQGYLLERQESVSHSHSAQAVQWGEGQGVTYSASSGSSSFSVKRKVSGEGAYNEYFQGEVSGSATFDAERGASGQDGLGADFGLGGDFDDFDFGDFFK